MATLRDLEVQRIQFQRFSEVGGSNPSKTNPNT